MGPLLTNLDLVDSDLILGMGIKFWVKLMEDQKITSINHCQHVINYIQGFIDNLICKNDIDSKRNIKDINDKNFKEIQNTSEILDQDVVLIIILALGIKFWQKTVVEHKVKDLKHCKVIINYVQGFMSDFNNKLLSEIPNIKDDNESKLEYFVETKLEINNDEDSFEDEWMGGFDNVSHGDIEEENSKSNKPEGNVMLKILKQINSDENDSDYDYDDDDYNPQKKKIGRRRKHEEEDEEDRILRIIERARNRPLNKRKDMCQTMKCDYCEEVFPSVYIMSKHIILAHENRMEEFDQKYKIYDCYKPECGKTYYTIKTLHKHYREFHKENVKDVSIYSKQAILAKSNARCEECNLDFKLQANFEDHKEEHKKGLGTKLFQCDICKKRFHYRTQLKKHLIFKDISEESTLCVHCGESFNNRCELKEHKKIHTKERYREREKLRLKKPQGPVKCFYCDLIFPNQSKRSSHMYNIHDHGAVFCDICGKRCSNKIKLGIHLAVHNEKSAFECEHCGKGFRSRAKVERHIATVHTSDADKKWQCPHCGKGFHERNVMKTHMNIHLGLKPHKCDVCGVGFADRSNMLAHRRKTCKQL